MPEKTADDLARILSLASSSTLRGTWNANEAAGPAAGPAPPAPGPLFRPERPVEPGAPQRDFSPGLIWYDFGSPGSEEGEEAGGARPRFNSKDSKTSEGADESSNWNASYNHHLLESVGSGAAAPDDGLSAMGPHTYGAFHNDPNGPALDRESEMGPCGPPMHLSEGMPASPVVSETDIAAGPAVGAGLDLETAGPRIQQLERSGRNFGLHVRTGGLGGLGGLGGMSHSMPHGAQFGAQLSPNSFDFRFLAVKREDFVESHFDRPYALQHGGEEATTSGRLHTPEKSAAVEQKGKDRELRRTDTGRAGARTSILTEDQAVEVFKMRPAVRSERASLCAELAEKYGVTTTAIRHIWDRRTWVWTNMPQWTEAEMAASLAEGMCDTCRKNKINKIEDTCGECPLNRKRGRPRGARDTYRRQRKANGSATPVHRGAPDRGQD